MWCWQQDSRLFSALCCPFTCVKGPLLRRIVELIEEYCEWYLSILWEVGKVYLPLLKGFKEKMFIVIATPVPVRIGLF